MQLNRDFRELLSALSSAQVRYLIVGGYAVMHHTEPRYTKDLDIWVDPSANNAHRVFRALTRFGAPLRGISESDFTNPKLVYQMGVEPMRIDILMGVTGLRFAAAWRRRVRARWGRIMVNVLSPKDLIANKSRVMRDQDRLDVARLRPLVRLRSTSRG